MKEEEYSVVSAAIKEAGQEYGFFHEALLDNVDLMPHDTEWLQVNVNSGERNILMYRRTPQADRMVKLLSKAESFDNMIPQLRQNKRKAGRGLKGDGPRTFTLTPQLGLFYFNTYMGITS